MPPEEAIVGSRLEVASRRGHEITQAPFFAGAVGDWGQKILGVGRNNISAPSYFKLERTPGDLLYWLASSYKST